MDIMNTECDICCEEGIIMPCGALNNCKVNVCNNCRIDGHDGNYDYMSRKCVYCKCYDYKTGLIDELNYDIFEYHPDSGGEMSNTYILCLYQMKKLNTIWTLNDEDYNEIPFCLPCDED
tara:strand:+ start:212 stop:568 length:357 start_codon:yes stop_codon:yes gene_type:complete